MALSTAQIAEHVGRCMAQLLARSFQDGSLNPRELLAGALDYIRNGTSGTQAQRKEAMLDFARRLFRATTGRDAAANDHEFRKHWLFEGSESGEV